MNEEKRVEEEEDSADKTQKNAEAETKKAERFNTFRFSLFIKNDILQYQFGAGIFRFTQPDGV